MIYSQNPVCTLSWTHNTPQPHTYAPPAPRWQCRNHALETKERPGPKPLSPSPLTPQPAGPQPWFLAPAVVQAVAVSSWYMGWESLKVCLKKHVSELLLCCNRAPLLPPSTILTLSFCYSLSLSPHPLPLSLSFLLSLLQPGVLCATLPASAISVQSEATLQQVHPIRFHSIRDWVQWVQTAHPWWWRHRTITFAQNLSKV